MIKLHDPSYTLGNICYSITIHRSRAPNTAQRVAILIAHTHAHALHSLTADFGAGAVRAARHVPVMSLNDVQALLFDVFGTVVDWRGSIIRRLQHAAPFPEDWAAFADEWRIGYIHITLRVAAGGEGPRNVDDMHRQILDGMLASARWAALGPVWDSAARDDLVQAWHFLDPWPDAVPGLTVLKHAYIIGTLSNGNVKLLVDMAKNANLPWDVVFSSSLFGSYKPNPEVYTSAARHLSLPTHAVALVAAHIDDCAAARACGFRTIYIPRPTEDRGRDVDTSAVDLVASNFEELAAALSEIQST